LTDDTRELSQER